MRNIIINCQLFQKSLDFLEWLPNLLRLSGLANFFPKELNHNHIEEGWDPFWVIESWAVLKGGWITPQFSRHLIGSLQGGWWCP